MTISHANLVVLAYVLGFALFIFISIIIALLKFFTYIVNEMKREAKDRKREIEILKRNGRF